MSRKLMVALLVLTIGSTGAMAFGKKPPAEDTSSGRDSQQQIIDAVRGSSHQAAPWTRPSVDRDMDSAQSDHDNSDHDN